MAEDIAHMGPMLTPAWLAGRVAEAVSGRVGTTFLIGCGGAALAVTAQRSVWRAVRPGT